MTEELKSSAHDYYARVRKEWETRAKAHDAHALSFELHAEADQFDYPAIAKQNLELAASYRALAEEARACAANF